MPEEQILIPVRKHPANSAVIVDRLGHEYFAITLNEPPGGVAVYKQDKNTGAVTRILAPGSAEAYTLVGLAVNEGGWGKLYAFDGPGNLINKWGIPGWAQITSAPSAPSTGVDLGPLYQRIEALEARVNSGFAATNEALDTFVTARDVEEIAWAKAGDRFVDFWNKLVTYEYPQLFNVIHNRIAVFAERFLGKPGIVKNPDSSTRF